MSHAKIAWCLLAMLWSPRAHNQDRPFEGDLEGWLATVKIAVPADAIKPIDVHFKILGVSHSAKIQVHSLECEGLRVGEEQLDGNIRKRTSGGLSSHLLGRDLQLRVANVTLSCSGTVQYYTSMGISGSADAIVSMDNAELSTILRFTSLDGTMSKIPNKVEMVSCTSKLKLQLNIVSGTAVTVIAEHMPGVVPKLQNLLNAALDKYTCSSLLDGARHHISTLLEDVHKSLQGYTDAAHPQCPTWDTSFMPLEDVPVLNWARGFSDGVVSKGYIDRVVHQVYPAGYWPLVGSDEWALRRPTCLLGSSSETDRCAAA